MTLTEFLTARLDEDEAVAHKALLHYQHVLGIRHTFTANQGTSVAMTPITALAEVEAKRRIVAGYPHAPMAGGLFSGPLGGDRTDGSLHEAMDQAVRKYRWSGMDVLTDEVTKVAQARLDDAAYRQDEQEREGLTAARDGTEAMLRDWTLRVLALPYAEHPDYDAAWRP